MRTKRDYKVLYEEADYSDQKVRDAMIDHVFYDEMMRVKKNKPEFMAYEDYDKMRMDRRRKICRKHLDAFEEEMESICSDIPGVYYNAEEWAELCAATTTGYDALNRDYDIVYAAVIFIVRQILAENHDFELMDLFSDSPEDEILWMEDALYTVDLGVESEVYRAVMYIIQHRNDDLKGYGKKRTGLNGTCWMT